MSSGSTRTCQCPHTSHSAPTGRKFCNGVLPGLRGCQDCVLLDGHSSKYHEAYKGSPDHDDKWFNTYDNMLKWKYLPQTIRPTDCNTYWQGYLKHHEGYEQLGVPWLRPKPKRGSSKGEEKSINSASSGSREVIDLTMDTPASTAWNGENTDIGLDTPYSYKDYDNLPVPDFSPSTHVHGSYENYSILSEFQGHFPLIQRPQFQTVTDMSIAPQWQDHFPPLGMQEPQQQQQQQAFDYATEGEDTTMSEEDQKWWEENTRDFRS